jgi:3-oxoacyl-(acyl-carrier-protein) synthase
LSLADAFQQLVVAQVEPAVEDKALEREERQNETAAAILCKGICSQQRRGGKTSKQGRERVTITLTPRAMAWKKPKRDLLKNL